MTKSKTTLVYLAKGLCFSLLLSLFAVVPASSSESTTSESLDLKEVYIYAERKVQIRYLGDFESKLVSNRPEKYHWLTPGEGKLDFPQTRLYLLHQCLKLFD